MSVFKRREFPIIFTFVVGMSMLVDYYINVKQITDFSTMFMQWAIILTGFAAIRGCVNITIREARSIRVRTPNLWPFSILALIVVYTYLIIGVYFGVSNAYYLWLTQYITNMLPYMAVNALFIVSAAIRTFKFRTVEGSIMLLSSIIGLAASSTFFSFYGGAPLVTTYEWLRDSPSTAALIAIQMTGAIGSVVMGVRTLLGYETSISGE